MFCYFYSDVLLIFCGSISIFRYKKVGYLDTDVGQPEFSPPGFLSLTVVDEVTPGNCLFFALLVNNLFHTVNC